MHSLFATAGRFWGGWIAFLVLFGAISMTFKGQFSDAFTIPNSDSQNALDLLTKRFPAEAGDQARIVFQSDSGIADPSVQTQIKSVLATIATMPHVARIESPLDNPAQINTTDIVPQGNGTVAYATVHFDQTRRRSPEKGHRCVHCHR